MSIKFLYGVTVNGDSTFTDNVGVSNLNVNGTLQIDNQAKWKTNMTTRQIRIFEGAVNRTLTEFGYPLITDAKPLSLPIKAFWRTHNQLMTFLNNNFRE